jgi:hypothetical protein
MMSRSLAVLLLATLPFALLLQLLAWLRWGIDVPYQDDWRIFILKEAGSFSLTDLLRPGNDSMYPTGKILDALSVRYLGYNSVIYQAVSLVGCLGSLLWLHIHSSAGQLLGPSKHCVPPSDSANHSFGKHSHCIHVTTFYVGTNRVDCGS